MITLFLMLILRQYFWSMSGRQEVLAVHHASFETNQIIALYDKNDLKMTTERLVSDEANFSTHDRSFIRD